MPTRLKTELVSFPTVKPVPSSVIVSGRTSVSIGRVTEPEETFVYKAVDSQRTAWVVLLSGRIGAGVLEARLLLGLKGWR